MKRLIHWLSATLLAACPLSGCHTAPTIEVADARVTDRTPEALLLEFDLAAANPNEFDLPVQDVRYTLALDGRPVFRGVRAGQATIARERGHRIVIPAVVPLESAPAGQARYTLTGEVQYLTPSELADVLYDARLRRPAVSFSERGVLDFGTSSLEPDAEGAAASEPDVPDQPRSASDSTVAPEEVQAATARPALEPMTEIAPSQGR